MRMLYSFIGMGALAGTTITASLINNVFDPQLVHQQPLATAFLTKAILRGRLAHAYLFTGCSVDDNMVLAKGLAAFLNCTKKDALPAGQEELSQNQLSCNLRLSGREVADVLSTYCQNCRWILADKHPQALLVLGSEGSKSGRIAVEKTRQLTEELAKESQYMRVVLIEDACQDVFHRPAANAILKTIESPRSAVVFMLFARRAEEVLPTVVSRCQVVPLLSAGKHLIYLGDERQMPGTGPVTATLAPETQGSESALASNSWVHAITDKISALNKKTASLTFLDLAKELQDLAADGVEPESLIDVLIASEVAKFRAGAPGSARISKYLQMLVLLAEDAKLQIDQYVAIKPALESFCLAWWQLKNEHGLW
jgi:DNA polymerase III, delta subunit